MSSEKSKPKNHIVSIDFDGVLSQYKGWQGDEIIDEPIEGAKEFLQKLIDSGYTPVVFTVRDALYVQEWLKKFDFPELEVTNQKIPSLVYIDDRCIKFEGDYEKLTQDLKNFEIYWKEEGSKLFKNLK
ncbi:hypothetical protein ACFL1U_00315 [Patescibacteria group bacterium]